MRVKIGDNVEVISGRAKGERGEVLRVLPKENRLLVKGVSMRKKHQRQIQAGGRTMTPGIIQFEAPIEVSNVMLICPRCDELTRVGIKREGKERRRLCKRCGEYLDS